MATTLTMAECDTLNERARAMRATQSDPDDSVGVGEALSLVASEAGLEVEEEDGDCCTIYRAPDGRLVNCWSYGPQSYEIEDGGAGFDDQVEWYTEREEEEVTA